MNISRLVFLLCLVLLISSFSACNFQEKESTTSDLEESKTENSFEPTQEEIEKAKATENSTNEPTSPENADTPALESEAPIVSERTPETQIETPAETPKNPISLTWKEAYLNYLETMKDYHRTYALVYIDNDDIPELYLNGNDEATGDGVCTFLNGRIVEQRLGRTWGGNYIEKSGELFNFNGNMGCYYTHVYKLTPQGFSQTFSALTMEELIRWENDKPILSYKFFVEDAAVSETEYNDARNAAFNYAQSKSLHENAVTYDQIVELIKQHN